MKRIIIQIKYDSKMYNKFILIVKGKNKEKKENKEKKTEKKLFI